MLRPTTPKDPQLLAPHLRQADVKEMLACGHTDMQAVLQESVEASEESWAFEVEEKVLALLGVVAGEGHGTPWLLGSEELFRYKKELLTLPALYIPRWLDKHGLLCNIVHVQNHKSVRWLQRIGFTLEKPVLLNGHPFYPFHMRKNYV